MSKKIPYQKKPHQEHKKGALSRNLIKKIKSINKAGLSVY